MGIVPDLASMRKELTLNLHNDSITITLMSSIREFGIRGGYSTHTMEPFLSTHRVTEYGFSGTFTEHEGTITGSVKDVLGDASVSGTITRESLEFTKIYPDTDRCPIVYNYGLQGEVYRGRYSGADVDNGDTYCRILEGATPAAHPGELTEDQKPTFEEFRLP
ncbi:MAG: hypothetical protein KBC15_00050 [Candidatus Levybacteria bacterium]|nr:hypothetical protein [Candidatus Levybacteria bacterium]